MSKLDSEFLDSHQATRLDKISALSTALHNAVMTDLETGLAVTKRKYYEESTGHEIEKTVGSRPVPKHYFDYLQWLVTGGVDSLSADEVIQPFVINVGIDAKPNDLS